jgi:hypothetical protein
LRKRTSWPICIGSRSPRIAATCELEPNWLDDHSLFSSLGADAALRSVAYQVLLNEAVSEACVDTIRAALNTGQALGSEKFKDQIEAVHRGRVRHLSAGRKPKWKDQVEGEQPALDL